MKKIKIGTRKSKLALAQTNLVIKELKKHFSNLQIEIIPITTKGDVILDKPLSEINDKGLFINEFENALKDNKIDIAIHSAKDLPSKLKDGLEIVSVLKRADAKDVLITRKNSKKITIIGTSSPRREFYIKQLFPNAQIKTIRGNIDTRLKKLEENQYDAIILAKAGLDRLNILNSEKDKFDFKIFDTDKITPAACQGIIAIEAKKDFEFKNEIMQINDTETFKQFMVEREILKQLEVNCSDINAIYSKFNNKNIIEITIMYKGKKTKITDNYLEIFEKIPKIIAEIKS